MKYPYTKLQPNKDLAEVATKEWVALLKTRNFAISNILLGSVSASGFIRKPNYQGAICQPFILLPNEAEDADNTVPTQLQPHLPGTGLGYLVTAADLTPKDDLQVVVWKELQRKLGSYRDWGMQTLYSPSSLPVDSINSGSGFMPTSIGTFVGHCRRQLSLRNHLNYKVDWEIKVTSYKVPAWEAQGMSVAAPVEVLEDLVLPAIGEYIALMLQAPIAFKGRAKQQDEIYYRMLMAGSVLANLKAFDKLITRLSETLYDSSTLPDMTEFRTKLDFAEKYVDAVAGEIAEKVAKPGAWQAPDIDNCKLIHLFSSVADKYGTELEYLPFNRGLLAEGVERHQAETWKANPNYLTSKIYRINCKKHYDSYLTLVKECTFNRVSCYAFDRTYPESYVVEVVDKLDWPSWKDNQGKVFSHEHDVWDALEAGFERLQPY